MIPGLLDSQIKTMSGDELAREVVGSVIGIVSPAKSQRTQDEHVAMRSELIAYLARIIDSIREADQA